MLNTLSSTNSSKKRVGRGGKRGKTAGRGHKGQKQHGGHGIRVEARDMIKKIPKLRGHGVNRARTVVHKQPVFPVNVAQLESLFTAGATVTPQSLIDAGVLSQGEASRRGIKVLAHGDLSKKLTVTGMKVSATAQAKIEKAGGTVTV